MNLGYSITARHPADADPSGVTAELVRRVRLALEIGYDYVQTPDRHVVPDGLFLQNVPMAGRLAAEVDHLASLYPIPLYPPVHVAEYAGTLAALVDRFDFWCSIGMRPEAFDTAGVPKTERAPRFEEGLDLIRRLWNGDPVTFEGEYYAVDDVSIAPTADPRVCIAGKAEPAVRRAARLGDAWVAAPLESMADLERELGWYRDGGGGDVIVRRDALVLENGDRAHGIANDLLADGYRGLSPDTDALMVGDGTEAAAMLADLEALGADDVVVRPMLLEHADETIREVGRAARR